MSEYWTKEHGPRFMKTPGLVRYVQNHVIEPIGAEGPSDADIAFRRLLVRVVREPRFSKVR